MGPIRNNREPHRRLVSVLLVVTTAAVVVVLAVSGLLSGNRIGYAGAAPVTTSPDPAPVTVVTGTTVPPPVASSAAGSTTRVEPTTTTTTTTAPLRTTVAATTVTSSGTATSTGQTTTTTTCPSTTGPTASTTTTGRPCETKVSACPTVTTTATTSAAPCVDVESGVSSTISTIVTTTTSTTTTTTTDRPVVLTTTDPQIPAPPRNQPAPERTVPDDLSQSSPCAVITGPMAKGQYTVSSPFGQRGGEFHRGIDLAAREGTPIYAALDGKVSAAGPATGFGNWIVIDSTTSSGQVSTVYGHMYDNGLHVRTGDIVKAGQHIADVGSNGQSSGAHLHFELWQGLRLGSGKAVDPAPMLEQAAPAASQSALKIAHAIADCAVRPGTGLAPGKVPQEFVPWLVKGAAECPNSGITAPLLAGQLEAENNFNYGANAPVSSTGARGPAQFMPGTWETWKVDADSNGVADINSIADSVVAQAHFMCKNWKDTSAGVNSGSLQGDAVDLALAAYNAGFGAVQAAGGMPSGGDYTTQTRPYVRTIRDLERQFAATDFGATPDQQSDREAKAAQAAKEYLGTEYTWGGGNTKGPTLGGFDSPGLTSYVTYVATSGSTTLPRTVQQQWAQGDEIATDQAKPGDLVFSEWNSNGTPRHVGVAIGGGRMVHASSTDGTVAEADIAADAKVRSMS